MSIQDKVLAFILAGDGVTTVEIKLATKTPAKQVYNAIKGLTRKKLIRSTQFTGTLRRYWRRE